MSAWLSPLIVMAIFFAIMIFAWALASTSLTTDPELENSLGQQRTCRAEIAMSTLPPVWALYQRGKYDTAVFETMKAVDLLTQLARCRNYPRRRATVMASAIGFHSPRPAKGPISEPVTKRYHGRF